MPFLPFFKKSHETPVTLEKLYGSAHRDSESAESPEPRVFRDPFTPADSCTPRPVWLYGLDELYNIVQYSRHDFRGIAMMTYYADELRKIKPHITERIAYANNKRASTVFLRRNT